VIPYKGQAINIREIARQLNVATILEGSVRKSGNKLRITAQLIDARTDEHIWTEVYDRDLADIFKIQSEIAQAIADKFKIAITPEAYEKLIKPPTTNIKAYELYLKARSLSWGAGFGIGAHFGGAVNTITLLKEAIALDPDYVQPYVLLSTLYLRFSFGSARMENMENLGSYDSAVLLAKEAIIIDPTSADGYIALANTQNFENSLKWLYKAVELDSLMGLIGLAKAYRNKGEFPKAIQCFSEAVKYGPNSYEPYLGKAIIYSSMAQVDSMNKYLALSNKMAPNTREIYGTRMQWNVFKGKIDGTMELAKKFYGEDTLNFNKEMGIVYLMARNWKKAESYYLKTGYRDMDWGLVLINTGRRDSGMLVLKNSLAYRGPNGWPGDLSRINAVLGNKELAIADFEKLVGSGWHDIGWVRNDPFWDELREEPKFKKIAEAVERKNDEMLNQIEENQNRKFSLAF
jgi:tetratricopeptide (TPR) repeat protein